mmetsp:Transcript_91565/g.158750  ORF Transcript_91565/g.158750 Transcript_91565/m.158750 type:complete len:100 (+) Transcript_91565:2310-2609(+)
MILPFGSMVCSRKYTVTLLAAAGTISVLTSLSGASLLFFLNGSLQSGKYGSWVLRLRAAPSHGCPVEGPGATLSAFSCILRCRTEVNTVAGVGNGFTSA